MKATSPPTIRPVKVGVLGCGAHAHIHGRVVSDAPGAVLAACADIDAAKAADWAARWHCGASFGSLSDMLTATDLDAVILATWPVGHAAEIAACLNRGVKYILCEKALCLSGEEASSILEQSRSAGAVVLEAVMYRYHPAIGRLEELLASGSLGRIDSIRAVFSNFEPDSPTPGKTKDWRLKAECGGGVSHDWMSYCVNAANYLAGGVPTRVFASGTRGSESGVVTSLFAQIEYSNGVTASLESSRNGSFSQLLSVCTEGGRLNLPVAWGIFGDVTLSVERRKPEWDYIVTERFPITHRNPFALQFAHFLEVAAGQGTPRIPLIESVVNAYTIDAILSSARAHEAVAQILPENISAERISAQPMRKEHP